MIFLGREVRNYGKPYIVAEISANHGGDVSRAYELIAAAKKAGADAVKIQAYTADSLTLPTQFLIEGANPWNGMNLYELYMKASTPFEWIANLFDCASKQGISIFSSVYDDQGLRELTKNGCRAFKIASYEANDTNFLEKVVATGKPVVLSTGTLNDLEIERALKVLDPDNSIVLHCISKYPCEVNEIALIDMEMLQTMCNQPVGFSCHSDDPLSVILAAMKGAALIEVHLTLDDEEGEKSPDYDFSFTPDGLKYTIDRLNDVSKALLPKVNQDQDGKRFKRSLYVTRDMRTGEVFNESNLKSYRPNLGCEPYLLKDIIGKRASQDIKKNSPMKLEYIR
jgi:N-acetylneuraminate synthase